jgi:neutral trehalase
VLKKEFPQIHYYDQDFVDIYDRSWAWMSDFWRKADPAIGIKNPFYAYNGGDELSLYDCCLSSFFLVYFNKKYPVNLMLDNFYNLQEESGAIRGAYNLETGKPVLTAGNPDGLSPPLLAWVEYNLYHKVGAKKRVKDVMPYLMAYHDWLEKNFREENGMYAPPMEATMMENAPRDNVKYPVDFNTQVAINALYMSALADILNDKELGFRYKRQYFSLKTRINSLMWDPEDRIYYDLDARENRVKVKTIAAFWPLLAEIPNEERAEGLFEHLQNPESFGTENPFPTLAADEAAFDENGAGCRGAVVPGLTFMVIKGLEKYQKYVFAREASIRHMYFILDTFHPDGGKKGTLWHAYKPFKDGPAQWKGNDSWNRPLNLAQAGLATLALMIENVIGLFISLPRKTVDWFVPTLELMGIEELPLKRNRITIVSNKSSRGWEIRLESEKLYYFSIHLLDEGKKKTLPIPSGKCSMLIDKL